MKRPAPAAALAAAPTAPTAPTVPDRTPLKLLSVSSEMYPLLKTGGLADVVGALPAALAPLGVEMRTLLPGHPSVMAGLQALAPRPD